MQKITGIPDLGYESKVKKGARSRIIKAVYRQQGQVPQAPSWQCMGGGGAKSLEKFSSTGLYHQCFWSRLHLIRIRIQVLCWIRIQAVTESGCDCRQIVLWQKKIFNPQMELFCDQKPSGQFWPTSGSGSADPNVFGSNPVPDQEHYVPTVHLYSCASLPGQMWKSEANYTAATFRKMRP